MLISSTQHEEIRRTTGRRWEALLGKLRSFAVDSLSFKGSKNSAIHMGNMEKSVL